MQNSVQRIHPLVAAAAVSIILLSLLGVAAVTGVLPQSNSQPTTTVQAETKTPLQFQPRTGAYPATAVATGNAASTAGSGSAPGDGTARTAIGMAEQPVNLRDTLAPGETLIALPSKPASIPSTIAVLAPVAAPTAVPSPAPERKAEPILATPRTATVSTKAVLPDAPPVALAVTGEGADRGVTRSSRTSRSSDRFVSGTSATGASPTRLQDGADLRSSGSVANGNSASGAPVLRDNRRRRPVGSQVVTSVDPALAETPPPQRIVPVYRDQRTLRADVPLPGEGPESGVSEPVSPLYPQSGSGSGRVSVPEPADRRLNRSEQSGRVYPDQGRNDYRMHEGPVTRFGTTLGRSLGDGIDRTISAIADVLSGSRPVLPTPQPDAYGAVPGDR